MIPLPLIQRELQLASRRSGTYWARFAAAAMMIFLTFAMFSTTRQRNAQTGHTLFIMLSVLAFAYCLFAGIRYTADCLSEERREGTLGLLFLTDLRGFDIVLAKLIANSFYATYALLAVLPVLGLPLLVGSVTGSEFWRMCLLLLNTLLFSLAVGLLISAIGFSARQVMLGTFLVLVLVTFGFPAIWKAASTVHDARWLDVILLFPSPSYAFRMCTDARLRITSTEYWYSMEMLAALSLICISDREGKFPDLSAYFRLASTLEV
jgi:ABC-type transport system involved in multi-copper enzyme maturation permease subunit